MEENSEKKAEKHEKKEEGQKKWRPLPVPITVLAELITEAIREVAVKSIEEEKAAWDKEYYALLLGDSDDDEENNKSLELFPEVQFGCEKIVLYPGGPISYGDDPPAPQPVQEESLEETVADKQDAMDDDPSETNCGIPSVSSTAPTKQGLKRIIVLEGDDQVDDEELREFKRKNRNKNTKLKTEQITRRFHKFLTDKYEENRKMNTIPPEKLNFYIGNFLLMLKKETPPGVDPATLPVDQVEYQPETLTSYHRAIARHLRDEGYPYDIMKANEFVSTKGVLSTKKGQLKSMGLGNKPNRCVPMSDADTRKCWEVGSLGRSTPRILQNTVFYILATTYGWRARHEANQALWGDLEIKEGVDGRLFIEWTERASKTRNGEGEPRAFPPKVWDTQDERSIIKLFALYTSKRPDEMLDDYSPLFLTPKLKCSISEDICYKVSKMGPNSLAEIMGNIAKAAQIPGRVAGHTVRKTMCNKLYHAGVPETMICQLSGHKNVNSLQNYTMASTEQQQIMSDILTNPVHTNYQDLLAQRRGSSAPSSSASDTASARAVNDSVGGRSITTSVSSTTRTLEENARALLSGSTIHGDVHININYNVAGGHQSTQVNQSSPRIPISKE